ncbi:MAG: methionyl-tRNA formyltransferase [Chromatiales bacterium]|nr:MAG: methionyl-tRNA formyltransferase [Chromatiales bacterium]
MSRPILFAGTPDFAVPSLRALLAGGHAPAAVLTQPDRPAGRGRKPRPSPVKAVAIEHDIPVLQPRSLKSAAVQAQLREFAPELMVVVAYGLLLPPAVLELPRRGCINVHASLLPRWRGAAPIQAALLAGDTKTGVCLMQLEEGLDTGPVLARTVASIGPRETAGELHDRLADLGAQLLADRLDAILAGTLPAEAQAADGVSYAPRINKSDARLDWQRSAEELDRQVRAYSGWPVADTLLDGQQLRVWRAEPSEVTSSAPPGTVTGIDNAGVLVQTGNGQLRLLELQAAGRSRTSALEFARGRELAGKRLGT